MSETETSITCPYCAEGIPHPHDHDAAEGET
ncbi:hypothetical protein HNP84_000210 [Thermocatellispora tengchongensis]|uniref:Uncharacterized protein n=1 Tax=Thermocatellispora tengchongensis TaxID=1073253 RepID=A0A840NTE3_9ACTN|nr:hypothetical protein [Thermocatellispora tengchongensis]